ncbi:MAG: DUF547 domain-containing protein [Bryobacteraceae bacterium]
MRSISRLSWAVCSLAVTQLGAEKPSGNLTIPEISRYESVLEKYVREDGKVNYAGISTHPTDLSAFVTQIAAVSPDSAPALFKNREAQLSYWLNAYNAIVLQSFAADYPEKRERLTGVVGRASFFYRLKHTVGGKNRSLGDIEDNSIRKVFREPRIHFALVCASASCPFLSHTAYTAENLESHLEADAERYFAQSRNFRMDESKREVTLPRILDWFKDDFGGTPDKVLAFVAKYRKEESAKLNKGVWRIKYFDYDWSPNDTRP